ncbi:hypothetical protein HPULCUR_001745 [Helicostylum pulchrum]|uniref:Uncharacterized protein n=1 Tax=Helicostylum pulchrum TaxID=562976 RepID=A0ABP9XNI9_9FUNG
MLDEFGELFVFLMKKGRSIANRDLDIKWGYNVMRGSKNSLPKEEYRIREDIKDFFNDGFKDIFNEPELSVELIGSSHTQLALTFEFISMGIRLPQSCFREGALLCDHTNWKDTVYDVHYLAKCLRELGMEATLPIPLQNELDSLTISREYHVPLE